MKELIESLQKWLKRNKTDDASPADRGTHGQEKGTGIQKERGRTCVNLELLLVFSVEAGTAGNPAMFTTPQRKDVIYFTKMDCVTTAGMRVMGQTTVEVAHVSIASRVTTQAFTTNHQ